MTDENLTDQVKELNKRIVELENSISQILEPIKNMETVARGYIKLAGLAQRKGGVTIDSILPDVKDPISKSIIQALGENNGQNISQLTESVRNLRGTASRRIIRERLKKLVEIGHIKQKGEKKVQKYFLSDDVVKKWSQLLGLSL